MANLSQFMRKKFHYLFNQFYDSNKNGVITQSDFVEIVKNLQKLRKWTSTDDRLKACQESMNKAWTVLKRDADANKDNKVTLEEWYEYWSQFISKSKESSDGWPTSADWVKDYMNFWFDLMDTSGDGYVDENEFLQVCHYYSIPDGEAKSAYQILSGGKAINRDQFSGLWLEYMTSEDEAARGNCVFGKVNWTEIS